VDEVGMTSAYAAITGWGMAVPDRVVTSAELAARFGLDEEWITRRTGIHERRIASEDEFTSTLAVRAGRRALEAAGVRAEDIDLVVTATTTPDRLIPQTAPVVQAELGAESAGAFDVGAACAGFLTALAVCTALVRSGMATRCLAIGSEVLSRFVDWSDPKTCVLFGDGAGAVVVERVDHEAGLLTVEFGADGGEAGLIQVAAGGSARPASLATVEGAEHVIRMNGPEVFRLAVRTMTAGPEHVLRSSGTDVGDVDLFICHQANSRIVSECGERLGLPSEKVFCNVDRYGNTSAASIPIALCEAAEGGLLHDGSTVLLTAVGAGLVWSSGLVRWSRTPLNDSAAVAAVDLVGTSR
jgi:3-oxoacyl-[acyl-carrier-protein] synthase-3